MGGIRTPALGSPDEPLPVAFTDLARGEGEPQEGARQLAVELLGEGYCAPVGAGPQAFELGLAQLSHPPVLEGGEEGE
jgi:hypothetical protein